MAPPKDAPQSAKIEHCPVCNKNRRNNPFIGFGWWWVKGIGRMCYNCYDKQKEKLKCV